MTLKTMKDAFVTGQSRDGSYSLVFSFPDLATLHKAHSEWVAFGVKEAATPPTKKVIDLSVLVESGIDYEFSDSGKSWVIAKLVHVACGYYITSSGASWSKCRPRMNHVHAWMGGKCPLPEGLEVKVYHRKKDLVAITSTYRVSMSWSHCFGDGDIIAFEVLGKADESWLWPWESE